MKKIFIAGLIACSGIIPQFITAQQYKVVHVQGKHPHEVLTKKQQEGRWKQTKTKTKQVKAWVITPNCWVGDKIDPNYPVDSAYLLVKWTDGKRPPLTPDDSLLVWGYVWNTYSVFGTDTTWDVRHTEDMIRAVANADCRFTALLQRTSSNTGYSVGGFGYNQTPDQTTRVPLTYDYVGATTSPAISFQYTGAPFEECPQNGQTTIPVVPQTQVALAVDAGYTTGIIEHPLNASYGYPAYDYDYFVLTNDTVTYRWQAGWSNNGYWSFFTGENQQVPVDYASEGISTRVLQNNSTDGFVFAVDFDFNANMDGFMLPASCGCQLCLPDRENIRRNRK
jgi:hypothetical protein